MPSHRMAQRAVDAEATVLEHLTLARHALASARQRRDRSDEHASPDGVGRGVSMGLSEWVANLDVLRGVQTRRSSQKASQRLVDDAAIEDVGAPLLPPSSTELRSS